MSFTLKVKLTGLGLHVPHTDGGRALILLPDARDPDLADAPPFVFPDEAKYSQDEERLTPKFHIGFLRFDAASLVGAQPMPGKSEVVIRFERQRISFSTGNPKNSLQSSGLSDVADLSTVAPPLEVQDQFLQPVCNDKHLLGQVLLDEGTLSTGLNDTSGAWKFAGHLSGGSPIDLPRMCLVARWETQVNAPAAGIRLSSMTGDGAQHEFVLAPIDGELRATIGVTCCENPLEWTDLPFSEGGREDPDFRWYYRLLKPKTAGTSISDLLGDELLPVPEFVHTDGVGGEGSRCGRSTTSPRSFP